MKATFDRTQVPKRLLKIDTWGLWKFHSDKRKPNDKPRKVPLKLDGSFANPTSRDDFSSIDSVLKSHLIKNQHVCGLAFSIHEADNITLFDFDDLKSMKKGQRRAIMRLCGETYSEWSQSRNGVHCFFAGHDERIVRKKFDWNGIRTEVYTRARFVALTGDRVNGSPKKMVQITPELVEAALGKLPDDAMHDSGTLSNSAEIEKLESAEPTRTIEAIIKLIEDDSSSDPRDAGVVWEWIDTEGYGSGEDMSENDLIFCKVLWKYGATYSQIDELVQELNLRGDTKWARDDYRRSTILKAYAETVSSDFDDEGGRGDDDGGAGSVADFDDDSGGGKKGKGKKGEGKKAKKVRYLALMKEAREELHEAVREYNSELSGFGAGRVSDNASRRLNKKYRKCHKITNKINLLDVQRLNQHYGLIVVGKDAIVGCFYKGRKRMVSLHSFETTMRPQREAVKLKERAPRGVAETGVIKVESASSATNWLDNPARLEFMETPEMSPSPDALVGKSSFTEEDRMKPFNLFEGCRYDARLPRAKDEADPQPIIDHIHDVWASGDRVTGDYIIKWFARMVQRPWEVGKAAIVLKSIEGAGKNAITRIFNEYYGIHSLDIVDMDSVSRFNAMTNQGILTVFNEATYGGNKKTAGALKALVTEEMVTSEEKNMPRFRHRNCSHIMIFSNNDWILPVSENDRRFLILECSTDHMETEEKKVAYFDHLIDDCIRKGGDRAFVKYLMQLDIDDFRPTDFPPNRKENSAHKEQSMRGLSHFEQWIIDCALDRHFKLSSGVVIKWKKEKPLEISIPDLKDAYYASEYGRRSRSGPSSLFGIPKILEEILGCKVVSKRNIRHRGESGRGRGVVLGSLSEISKTCRYLRD